MMLPIAPTVQESDVSGVYALLLCLSDPAASKKRLDELVKAGTEAAAKVELANAELAKLSKETEKQRAAAADVLGKSEKAKADLAREASTQQAEFKARIDKLEAREAKLASGQRTLDADRDQFEATKTATSETLAKREAELDALASSLVKREADVTAGEAATSAEMKKANDLVAEYQTKVAALKAFAGHLEAAPRSNP